MGYAAGPVTTPRRELPFGMLRKAQMVSDDTCMAKVVDPSWLVPVPEVRRRVALIGGW
jgi:hypothetical protein